MEMILSEPRIIIALSMLGLASFMDLRNREVHDLVWIVFGSIGALMFLFEPDLVQNSIPLLFASSITVAIAYLAYRIGLFAGADALALVALVVIIPLYDGPNMLHNIAPLTILTNASIFASLFLMVNVVRNTISVVKGVALFSGFEESNWNKFIAFVLGYRASKPTFAYSIEVESGGGKKFDFSLLHAEKTDYCAKSGAWVMAGLPFIVYMLAGLVAMVFVGDIMTLLLSRFLS
jgi:preflagellin peptidase FlaK